MTSLREVVAQTTMAAPSIAALILAWFDAPLETWQIRCGIAFIGLQAAYLVWRWVREARNDTRPRKRRRQGDDHE